MPENGFSFIPEYYKIIANRRVVLSLRASKHLFKEGEVIKIESDCKDIEFLENDSYKINYNDAAENDIITINPKLVGRRLGDESIVTARCGKYSCEALLQVVSKIEKKKEQKHKRIQNTGLFNEIKFNPDLPKQIRHHFDRKKGILYISSSAPSIKKYLGPEGEGQDRIHCQVLIAELVMDAWCREIARRKQEQDKLKIIGDDITEAINKEINELIYKYGKLIHSALVDLNLL